MTKLVIALLLLSVGAAGGYFARGLDSPVSYGQYDGTHAVLLAAPPSPVPIAVSPVASSSDDATRRYAVFVEGQGQPDHQAFVYVVDEDCDGNAELRQAELGGPGSRHGQLRMCDEDDNGTLDGIDVMVICAPGAPATRGYHDMDGDGVFDLFVEPSSGGAYALFNPRANKVVKGEHGEYVEGGSEYDPDIWIVMVGGEECRFGRCNGEWIRVEENK